MTLTIGGSAAGSTKTVRARATCGFFRNGDLVEPGTVLELTEHEFGLHKTFNQVEKVEDETPQASEEADESAPKSRAKK